MKEIIFPVKKRNLLFYLFNMYLFSSIVILTILIIMPYLSFLYKSKPADILNSYIITRYHYVLTILIIPIIIEIVNYKFKKFFKR